MAPEGILWLTERVSIITQQGSRISSIVTVLCKWSGEGTEEMFSVQCIGKLFTEMTQGHRFIT